MRRSWLLLCGGSLALVCCGYPEFGFKPKKSTSSSSSAETTSTTSGGGMGGFGGMGGSSATSTTSTGEGGMGGDTTATTTTTTSTTTSSGSAGAGTVPCTPGTCAVGEVCCYHSASFSCDRCRDPGNCYDVDVCSATGSYTELECDEPNDCFAGAKCCIDTANGVLASKCKASCDVATESPACQDSVCLEGGICAGTGYAGYEICQ